jgi:elongation factor Ts
MSLELVKELRARTGAGMADCKKALDENKGDMNAAVDWLRAKGIASAAKKAGRVASEGLIGQYVHPGDRIAVIVEVNCETDFVALNDEFKAFVRDVAMHIAAERPLYVAKDDVPADAAEAERRVQIARVMEEGKPQAIAEKMVEGRMRKWFEEVVLLEQKFVKDDTKTVGEILAALIAKIGENLKIRRFARFEVGEGIERRSQDFAAEVAAAMNG